MSEQSRFYLSNKLCYMKHLVLDTSVWVAYFVLTDPLHTKAVNLFSAQNIFAQEVFVSDILLAEILTVLMYKWWPEFVENVRNLLTTLPSLHIEKQDIVSIVPSYLRLKKKISLQDVSAINLALSTKSDLVTFDDQQMGLYKKYRELLWTYIE